MPKIELGEFTDGTAKGFRYYYPKILPEEITLNELPFISREQLLYILNLALKQRYAEHVKLVKIPGHANRDKLGKALMIQVSQEMAKIYPDGILNTKDEVLANPPWDYHKTPAIKAT